MARSLLGHYNMKLPKWVPILGMISLVLLTGCPPSPTSAPAKQSVTQAALAQSFPPQPIGEPFRLVNFGASEYKAVSREWLFETVYPRYLHELGKLGLFKDGKPRWTGTAQCDYFADKLKAVAQEQHFEDTFHSFNPSESPAIGVVWYTPRGDPNARHAIVAAKLTDGSLIFVESQHWRGQEISLTETERFSIYFRRF